MTRVETWPALDVITALPCTLRTAEVVWHATVWRGPVPIVAVELGVVGQVPAWRLWLGTN